ncbi:MAG: LytTR family DNA-binding domain-containing protein [bacterium]|nr:LytTR family DNA-binding domain-containing protein [bacterium]
MKLKKVQNPKYDEIEVEIKYAVQDEDVNRLFSMLDAFDTQIRCIDDMGEHLVNASDILYIESVDRKTYVYPEQGVLMTEQRLYQLAEALKPSGFVQISKACLLNINTLECIKPLMNSRMEATLKNGEKVHINRKYLSSIKNALKGV